MNNKWIPISEKLPKRPEHDWVLIATKLEPEGWYGVPHIAEYHDEIGFFDGEGFEIQSTYGVEVTHWMELPENPKIEEV